MKYANLIPGLLLSICIAAVSFLIHLFTNFGGIEIIALILGLITAQIIKMPPAALPGITFTHQKIIGYVVALMAFQMQFSRLSLSFWLIPAVLLVIAFAVFGAKWLAQKQSVSPVGGYLIGVGQAICGISAIGAVAPVFKSKSEDTTMALGVITALGTAGMFVLPILADLLGFTDTEAGILLGGTLQTMGNTLGAGYAVSQQAGEIAILVKMFRVVLLGPIFILTVMAFQRKVDTLDTKKILPDYVILFVAFLVAVNVATISPELLDFIKIVNKWLITIVLAAIGLSINLRSIGQQAAKGMILGATIFIGQIILFLLYIYAERIF